MLRAKLAHLGPNPQVNQSFTTRSEITVSSAH